MTSRFPSRRATPMLALLLVCATRAQAHVKWFCGPIDASVAPQPLDRVVTPLFLTMLLLFTVLVAAGAMLDALIAVVVKGPMVGADRASALSDPLVRIGVALYALCLWGHLAVVLWADPANGSILTPDLYGSDKAVGYLQLAIAVTILIPRLSLVAATGLAALYAVGIAKFGPFYMIDYVFFLGIAAYLVLADPMIRRRVRLSEYRVPLLIGSLSVSLMWTAVEKFLYPQWTTFVLLQHPGMTAGYPLPIATTIAGFVEFSLAFYLMAGRDILGRFGAMLLAVIFVSAMPAFGMLDVVGHIPVVLILLVALITGETPLQAMVRGGHSGIVASGGRVSLTFAVAVAVLMTLYYGLHALAVLA